MNSGDLTEVLERHIMVSCKEDYFGSFIFKLISLFLLPNTLSRLRHAFVQFIVL